MPTTVEIAVLENPSTNSLDLLRFIQENLPRLVRQGQLRFSLSVIKRHKDRPVAFKDAKEYPAMITSKGIIAGVGKIKEYIEAYLTKLNGQHAAAKESSENDIESYQRSTLLSKNSDDEEDEGSRIQERLHQALSDRRMDPPAPGKRPNLDAHKEQFDAIFDKAYSSAERRSNVDSNTDDSLIDRFFDNHEETPMS